MSDMTGNHERQARDWRIVTVACLTALITTALAAYSAAASYESVAGLALAHGVPLARLNPLGIDGGLFGVIGVDIALTWLGRPITWLRLAARLFAAGTIAANAAAGWPDPVGSSLRVAAPVLFVILAEVARTVLLRRQRVAAGDDRIPFWRWLLDWRGTFRMWRRMKLWRVTSYEAAIDLELSRLQAIEKLRDRFGDTWQRAVPGHLRWMLERGVRMDEALAMVDEMTAEQATATATASGSGKRLPNARKRPARKRPAGGRPDTIDRQAQALAEYHRNPDINGAEMGKALGLSPSRGRAILAAVKATAPDTGPIPAVRETVASG